MRIVRSLPALFAICAIATRMAASQVPDGWFVVSSFRSTTLPSSQSPWPGLGGLYFVHPRDPLIPPTAVTGLGANLTGAGGSPARKGANCVARRASDGALVVGEIQPIGTPNVNIHLITLNGHQVSTDVTYSVGSATGSGASTPMGSVDQIVFVTDQIILFAFRGITSPVLGTTPLAILDLSTGAFTPVVLGSSVTGVINAVTLNASVTEAYFATFSTTAITSTIYRLMANSAPTQLATINGVVTNLAITNAGQLAACTLGTNNNGALPSMFLINPGTGAVTPLVTPAFARNALAIERVTGGFAVEREAYGPLAMAISWMTAAGNETVLTNGPAGGWGVLSGIDVNNDPEIFGPATTPGVRTYSWALSPNPGGLPQRGNGLFSLTLVSSPSGSPGMWAASLAPLIPSSPAPGFALNIDPAQIIGAGSLVGFMQEAIPLPIPLDPGLAGISVYFQTWHFDPAGLAASNGVTVTIL